MASEDILGAHVLVGVTCIDEDENLVAQFQTHGVLTDAREDAFLLRREDGTTFGLPPAPELFEPAAAGIYTLQATGEQLEDPDYLVSLTVTVRDPDSLSALEAHGFSPPTE